MRKSNLSWILVPLIVFAFVFLFFRDTSEVQAAASHIVISEIQVGKTASAADEFIELYNPTGSAVDISNWKLTKKTPTAGEEQTLVATLSGTIASNGYLLLASTNYTGSTAADITYSADDFTVAANNTVLLYSDNGVTLVDRVGFGTAADKESSAAVTIPVNKSLERKANSLSTATTMKIGGSDELQGNGEDTDNNMNDFIVRDIPQPQNSSSLIEPSVTPTLTPTLTLSPTPSDEPSPTATPSPTFSPSPTPSATPSPSLTPTLSPTPSATPSPSVTPTDIPTPTLSPTATPTPTLSLTPTVSSTPTPTLTVTPSATPTPNFPFPAFPKFQLQCTTQFIVVDAGFLRFRFPLFTCTLVRL